MYSYSPLFFLVLIFALVLATSRQLPAQCTNPSINLPDQQTPVDGNPDNAYCVTFTFDPAMVGLPPSLSMELEHSWQGDLSIFVNACGNTLNIMQRPGVIGSCAGSCPCGNSGNIGNQGSPVPVTFSDSGTADPENGIAVNGGTYGITADDACGVGTPGINSFASLWAACPPGQEITAQVCIGDHAFADDGVAQNVTLDFPNPVVCGCTDPNAPNYNPNATVDDGSCLPVPCTVTVSLPPAESICGGGGISLDAVVSNLQGTMPTYSWTATGGGLAYLSSTTVPNPTVTFPNNFTGSITYTITVTDGSCTASASTTVTVTSPPAPMIPADYVCTGHPATLSVTNGPYSSYSWSNNMTGNPIEVTTPGNYSVTVTDANGCEAVGTVVVLIQQDPVVNIMGDNVICPGGFTQLTATAGYVQYDWTPPGGAAGPNYTVTAPGQYDVLVTDGFGCQNDASFTVTQAPGPQPVISGGPFLCQGETLVLDAGAGYTAYSWSTGAMGQQIVVSTGGQYSVTVTNGSNCPGTATVNVAVIPPPTPGISGSPAICQNGTVTLTADPGYDTYLWSNNATTQSIDVSAPGTYEVTVTNADGCEGTASFTVSPAAQPMPVITGDLNICPGEVTTLTAGAGFDSYLWSDNSTDPNLTTSIPGSYSVTVTNADGCEGTATVQVVEEPEPMPSITGTTDFCPGGQASVSVSPAFDSYLWSDNSTGQTLVSGTAGAYTVTVTNAQGCSGIASVTLNELTPPVPSIAGDDQICDGSSTTLDAGAGYSQYDWSNGGAGQQTTVDAPGQYSVVVTDANGCTGTAQFTVNVLPNPAPFITGEPSFCPGTGTTLSADQNYATYQWSTGDTGPSVNVTAPGVYELTVTDANGCEGAASVTVNLFDAPVVAISGQTSICPGGMTVLVADAGFSTYQWSTGAGTQIITADAPGPYSVTVTDGNGCEATATVDVSAFTPPQPTITGDLIFCESEGGILDAGPGYSSYLWSTGSTNQILGVDAGGSYQVTVTDANGCEGYDAVTVAATSDPQPVIAGPAMICPGTSATLDAGAGYAAYQWSDGSTGQTLQISSGGMYSVTVTAGSSCTGAASTTITILDPQPVSISGEPAFCAGQSTELTAASGFVSYLWSTGSEDPSIQVDTPGDYSVTATDADGCEVETTVTVTENPGAEAEISGLLSFCTDDNTILDAGGGFAAYQWSTGATGQTIPVDQAGDYSVTVTNSSGCTDTDQVTVTEVPELAPVITGELDYCAGATTILDAGPGYATYSWSDGSTGQLLTAASPGVYSVTVTDANGCAGNATVTVVLNPLPSPAILGDDEYCAGGSTTLSADNTYSFYLWSDNSDQPSLTVNAPGTYGLTVTDANGCENSTAITVTENPVVPPPVTGAFAFCEGLSTTLEGGNGYVSYEWSDGTQGPLLVVNSGGTYELNVVDNNGCASSTAVAVTEYPVTAPQITGDNSFCSGETVSLDAGGGFQTYQWQDSTTTQTLDVSQGGVFTVTVTDANGCSSSDTYQVTENSLPNVTIGGSTSFCIGGSTTLNAGAGFTDYLWSDSSAGQSLLVNAPGDFSVTVTDANGCVGAASVTVSEDTELNPVVTGPAAFCAGGQTTLDAGDNYATYAWSDGSSGQTLTVLTPGSYAVTVADNNGCVGDTVVTVVENPLPVPQITGDLDFCAGAATSLNAGNGFAAYLWSDSTATPSLTVGLPGVYSVTVTDANGCRNSDQVTVVENPLPQPDIQGALAYCAGDATTLDAGAFATYLWTGGAGGQTLVVNVPGNYGVTVTDVNGCSGSDLVTVVENALPQPAITGTLSYCAGASTALNAGGGYAAYLWTDGSSGQNVTVGNPGPVGVTVADGNGCENSTTVTVVENPLPQPDIQGALLYCANSSTLLNAGAGYADYQWSTGSSSQNLAVSDPGDYSVTVTDANACQNSDQVTVVENPLPQPEIAGVLAFCMGESTTLSLTADYAAYAWSTGAGDPVLNVDTPGIYSVTVTDANGCTNDDVVNVNQNPLPQPQITGEPAYCAGAGTTLSVAAGFSSYQWTGGGEAPDLAVGAPGDYGVTVTDANGCVNSDQMTVTEYALPVVSIVGAAAFCSGEQTLLDAGAGFAAYQWSNGIQSQTIPVDMPGDYGVTVTDDNGCENNDLLTVVENPLPDFTIEGTGFFCAGDLTTLTATGGYPQYVWSDGVTGNVNAVDQPGLYTVTATTAAGCSEERSVEIAEIPLPVADAGAGQDLTCEINSVQIGGAGTTQGDVTYQWSGPGISSDNQGQPFPVVSAPGAYTLTVIDNQYGCVSASAAMTVADLAYEPAVALQVNDILDCVTPTVTLSGTGSETGADIVYRWYDGNGDQLTGVNGLTYETAAPQTYTLEVFDLATGCTAQVSATVQQEIEYPAAQAGAPQRLTCVVTTATLDGTASSGGPMMVYSWDTPNGSILSGAGTPTPQINEPGWYILQVLNTENGCATVDSVLVSQDIQPPLAVAGEDQQLDCHTETVTISSAGSSIGALYAYEWTNGAIFVSPEATVTVSEPGVYTLLVTNTDNGCTATDIVVVEEIGDFPTDMVLAADGPTCFGDSDGSIVVEGVTGGITPLVFSLNGEPFSSGRVFSQLASGEYEVVVQDATGCEFEATVIVPPANDVQLDLGDDVTIRIGGSAQLVAQVNLTPEQIAAFTWSSRDSLACPSCFEQTVMPGQTTDYAATVVDVNGCVATDVVTVFVENPQEIYVPSAFSPNGDGTNDVFMVYAGDDVAIVRSFLVFNRWGEVVFEVYDFPPNVEDYGWSGIFRDALYNSAVFAWYAEVEFIDGQTKLFKGDVTLMR